MHSIRNNDTIGAWIGGLIALLGVLFMLMPGMIGMDMMKSGFGMMFIGLFVVIIGLITTVLFGQRARAMDRILADKNILAHWTYDENESRQQVEQEFSSQVASNRSTFMIMLAWFVVIGGGFVGYSLMKDGEVDLLFVVLFFGTLVLLGLVAFFAPILARRQALRASREVIIARNGLVLNGALHTWVAPLNKLVGVQYQADANGRSLNFEIRYLTRASMTATTTYIVTVPVPAAQQQQAQQAALYFQSRR
jgi:hypothetical protein